MKRGKVNWLVLWAVGFRVLLVGHARGQTTVAPQDAHNYDGGEMMMKKLMLGVALIAGGRYV